MSGVLEDKGRGAAVLDRPSDNLAPPLPPRGTLMAAVTNVSWLVAHVGVVGRLLRVSAKADRDQPGRTTEAELHEREGRAEAGILT